MLNFWDFSLCIEDTRRVRIFINSIFNIKGTTWVMIIINVEGIVCDFEYEQAEKKLIKILQEAEEFDADKEAWISLEELKEVVGV